MPVSTMLSNEKKNHDELLLPKYSTNLTMVMRMRRTFVVVEGMVCITSIIRHVIIVKFVLY